MFNNKLKLTAIMVTVSLAVGLNVAQAAPLPMGTVLTIEPGNAVNIDNTEADACTMGSCLGILLAPDSWLWVNIGAGTDGGLVVGKNQLSGGQESGDSTLNNTPGEMTDAWLFFNRYGTFYADNSLNIFSDTSNDGTTTLNDFNVAWNGSSVPMTSGYKRYVAINNYIVALDGAENGNYELDYSVVDNCCFAPIAYRIILRGQIQPSVFVPPTAGDVIVNNLSGLASEWIPDVTSADGYPMTCAIVSQPTNGVATVDAGCTFGTYQSNDGFTGVDTFEYSVTAGGVSATAAVTVTVDPAQCDAYPIKMVMTTGGGQSLAVNIQLVTTFIGRLTTEQGLISGAKNKVTICPGTAVEFDSVSTVGTARCSINGIATAANGTVAVGDKLICTNKPDGSDTDRFTIKSDE